MNKKQQDLLLKLIEGYAGRMPPDVAAYELGEIKKAGFDKVRFVAPVRAGARIRGRFKLEALTQRSPTEWQVRNAVKVEIEGSEKPALIAEWLSVFVLAPEPDTRNP